MAVRLPTSIVEMLGLREGDDVVIEIAGDREFRILGNQSRLLALSRLKQLNWKLPAGFVFSRCDDDLRET